MEYIKTQKELEKIKDFMEIAAEEAKKSTCKKSHRGAIIVRNNKIIGLGHNKPLLEEFCNPCVREDIKDNSRVELCSAIHAEQMAILNAIKKGNLLDGSRMYNVKIKDGVMQPSGKPSCTVCSRIIYFACIEMVFWHKEWYTLYSPEEFNTLSFYYFKK